MFEKYEWTRKLKIGDLIYIELKGFMGAKCYRLTKIHEILPNGNLIFEHDQKLIFDVNGDTRYSHNYNKELKEWSVEFENELKEKVKCNEMISKIRNYNKFHTLTNDEIISIHNILFEKEKEDE